MYEVRNKFGQTIGDAWESLSEAKKMCDDYASIDKTYNKSKHSPFSVIEVKQVWVSQTLDEAMKEK